MKNEFIKTKEYFPYKIFQKNEVNKRNYLNNNKVELYKRKKKKVALDICKNLKSVTKSSEVFSGYMDNYINITQDHCFKTPTNTIYPLRKNSRYLSAASIQEIKRKYKLASSKNKRPISAVIPSHNKLMERKSIIKRKQIIENQKLKINSFNRRNLYLNKNTLSERYSKSIDLDNDKSVKNKNFEYIMDYVSKYSYKRFEGIDSDFNKTKLSCEKVLSDENLKYELKIYSICLKFRLVDDNVDKNKGNYQKIYLPFKYLPIFYLLDYQLFKVFISEIISHETKFYFNNNSITDICDKYSAYINLHINDNITNLDDIIFNKNEFIFLTDYKWIVYNKQIKYENNKYKIYDLRIEFPQIKLKILDKGTIIKNILKKSLLINLMENDFQLWHKTVLFELLFIKKIRNVINSLIKEDSKYIKQKIDIFPVSLVKNQNEDKILQFFFSDMNNKISKYYIFNPYKIIIFDRIKKSHQEIQLSLKESRILYRFKNIWGIKNTLLKCIYIENIKDEDNEDDIKINFKIDVLSNISNDYMKNFEKILLDKKEKEKNQLRMNKKDILFINCSLKRILINKNKSEEKLFELKQEFINMILSRKIGIKNNNLIFEKIGKFCEDFLKETELNISIFNKKRNLFEENEKNNENNNYILNPKRSLIGINNKLSNTIINLKENKITNAILSRNLGIKNLKNSSNKKKLLSANINSKNKKQIKKTKYKDVKDTLFLTKNLSNNRVEELSFPVEESSEELSIDIRERYSNSLNCKSVKHINNQKDLKRNRIMSNYYLLNKDFNYNKLKRIISFLKAKKKEENIHNKY